MIRLFQILTLLCFLSFNSAYADSKKGFPKINSRDFKHFINDKGLPNNPFIYIYSSASILKSSKKETSYSLTSKEIPYIAPASRISIFPEISTQTRSEYFDFTIWGHLGNYFNQSAEIIELENRVVEIFEIIDSINKKYQSLNLTYSKTGFNKQYTITADRSNFFSIIPSSNKTGGNEDPETPRNGHHELKTKKNKNLTSKKRELLKFRALNPSQIRLNEAIVSRHAESLKGERLLVDSRISEELLNSSVHALRQVEVGTNTFVDKIIYFVTEAPGYIKENPIESFIYVIFIYFFFKILTMIFLRR